MPGAAFYACSCLLCLELPFIQVAVLSCMELPFYAWSGTFSFMLGAALLGQEPQFFLGSPFMPGGTLLCQEPFYAWSSTFMSGAAILCLQPHFRSSVVEPVQS